MFSCIDVSNINSASEFPQTFSCTIYPQTILSESFSSTDVLPTNSSSSSYCTNLPSTIPPYSYSCVNVLPIHSSDSFSHMNILIVILSDYPSCKSFNNYCITVLPNKPSSLSCTVFQNNPYS